MTLTARYAWWEEAFPLARSPSELNGHPRGRADMLIIIAYDITEPKRLKKVADCCKDFGVRVQLSVFECHLEGARLNEFWERLCELADKNEDRIVAYPIHGSSRHDIRTFGVMTTTERPISYQY